MKQTNKVSKTNKIAKKPKITDLLKAHGDDVQGLFIDLIAIEDAADKLTIEFDGLIKNSTDEIILRFLCLSDFETVRDYIALQEQTDFKILTPSVIREYKAIHYSLFENHETTSPE